MKTETSVKADKDERSLPEVMAFETTMVCYIDPAKGGDQVPKCTIKSIKVVNEGENDNTLTMARADHPEPLNTKTEVSSNPPEEIGQVSSDPQEENQDSTVDSMLECMMKNDGCK